MTLARIVRPWGRRGEVAAEILTDFPERLTDMREAWLADARGALRHVKILSCRIHLRQAIFHFEGTQSISEAETLRGLEVQVPLSERAHLREGRYFIEDLVGCEVWEADSTVPLGTVQEVQRAGEEQRSRLPESWNLVVARAAGELLIPLAAEICTHIDTAARRIQVRLPEGLRDLNGT